MKQLINTQPLSPTLKWVLKIPRAMTSSVRVLPDFLIIGAQKCGTTSLQRYLIQHPCIAPAFRKEVHFFDKNLRKGTSWYRGHFPSVLYKYYVMAVLRRRFMTGEASPAYIFYPHAPKRVLETVPHAKLIILLRNPIDRAYSHHQHEVANGHETASFKDAIELEPERLRDEREKMLADENYDSYPYRHYSYLSRGLYADQLAVWLGLFPKEQLCVLRSEDFFVDPSGVFRQVLRFLNLSGWEMPDYKQYNAGEYQHMDAATRKHLVQYFAPHNRRLSELLGRHFAWDH